MIKRGAKINSFSKRLVAEPPVVAEPPAAFHAYK
jgi:hypothetical protein